MQPDQPDKVWISREEYEHLRQQRQTAVAQTQPQPTVYMAKPDQPADVRPIQVGIGILLAIGLYISLIVPFARIVTIPVLLVMLIFAAVSLNDFLKARRKSASATGLSAGSPVNSSTTGITTATFSPSNTKYRSYRTLLIVLVCLLAAPFVLFAGAIIIFIIALSAGGGHFG